MCGEMAGSIDAIPLLVGMGLDEFSMNAPAILVAKEFILQLDSQAMSGFAAVALNAATADEIRATVRGLPNYPACNNPILKQTL